MCNGISVDPTTNPVYDFELSRFDTSGYRQVNFSGRIYDNTVAEIPDSTDARFRFFNAKGGQWWINISYNSVSSYSAFTKAFGTDCFVCFENAPFQFYKTGENLSADLTNYDFIQPSTGYTTVTFKGISGTISHGFLVLPSYKTLVEHAEAFLSGSSTAIDIYNP